MRSELLAVALALAMTGAATAQTAETPPVEPVGVEVPSVPSVEGVGVEVPADPDEPPPPPRNYVAAQCLAALVPAGARCGVLGTSTLGGGAGADMNWQLYEITSGRQRSGLSVLLAGGRVIDTTPVPRGQIDTWARDPYVMASVIKRDNADYAVVMVPGDERPAAFSVLRSDAGGWTKLDTNQLWPTVGARLKAVTGPQCYPVTSDMSWRAFSLRYGMLSDEGNCGSAVVGLGVENNVVVVTDAMAVKPNLTPARRRSRRR